MPNETVTRRRLASVHPDEWVVIGALILLTVASVAVALSPGYYLEQDILACRLSGYGALAFLAASILLGPLLRGSRWLGLQVEFRVSVRVSKNTGIASALAALVHAVISLTGYLDGHWREMLDYTYLYAGLLALLVLVLLLGFSIRPLVSPADWHLWKPTFRLSFAAALLVLAHLLFAPFASIQWTLGLYGGGTLLFLVRFLPVKRNLPPRESQGAPDLPTNS